MTRLAKLLASNLPLAGRAAARAGSDGSAGGPGRRCDTLAGPCFSCVSRRCPPADDLLLVQRNLLAILGCLLPVPLPAAHAKALAAKRGLNNPLEHPLVRAFRSRSQ